MVFYLKYRPKTLSELDNSYVAGLISKYLAKEPFPHAFLFVGPKGTGKTSTARIVAKIVNCKNKKNGEACGICPICLSISKGTQLDVLEIDAASNRGIDEIRDLREKIKLFPLELKYKVYIIDEVHMLTTEAFNALLKTLEEPPVHAIFILATTESHKVPETVASRCIQVAFNRAAEDDLVKSLKRIVLGEKLDIEDNALIEIAAASDGSFRDGAKLLQELTLEVSHIGISEVRKKIGSIDSGTLNIFLESLRLKKTKELIETILQLVAEGKNIHRFFWVVLQSLEKELVRAYSGYITTWEKADLRQIINLLSQAFSQLKTAVISTLPFELAIIEYAEDKITLARKSKSKINQEDHQQASNDIVVDESTARTYQDKWQEIIEKIKPQNNSLSGVLRSCKPLYVDNGVLFIEAAYKFHAERLNEAVMQNILAKTIQDVIGSDIKIKTILKKRS